MNEFKKTISAFTDAFKESDLQGSFVNVVASSLNLFEDTAKFLELVAENLEENVFQKDERETLNRDEKIDIYMSTYNKDTKGNE
jgi:hypothetical protein